MIYKLEIRVEQRCYFMEITYTASSFLFEHMVSFLMTKKDTYTGEMMIKETLQIEQINTDADASIKGIGLQKLRAAKRLLEALKEEKRAIFCTIEHIDDVLEVDLEAGTTDYVTKQDKSYSTNFSMNDHEIKNSLRIFFDNWFGAVEGSESIKFVFYTNADTKKEKKVGVLKKIKQELPEEPLLNLLNEKRYKEAFPFVLPIFKEYYIDQHKKHVETPEEIEVYEKILKSMSDDKWVQFFDLIEWNFGKPDENEVRVNINTLVEELCIKFNVDKKYARVIIAQILDMIESRKFEKDFLHRIVHVGEIKVLFLELVQDAKMQEKLDPMHEKWDGIQCDDVRSLREKFVCVCPEYELDSIEEFEEEYIDGAFEQSNHQNLRQVKAYNYRVYKICHKIIKRFLKEHKENLSQVKIEILIEDLIDKAYALICDKAKTYDVAFEDRDMIRKTIIILFQDCYLALDGR